MHMYIHAYYLHTLLPTYRRLRNGHPSGARRLRRVRRLFAGHSSRVRLKWYVPIYPCLETGTNASTPAYDDSGPAWS